jgi:hypothetical protein
LILISRWLGKSSEACAPVSNEAKRPSRSANIDDHNLASYWGFFKAPPVDRDAAKTFYFAVQINRSAPLNRR